MKNNMLKKLSIGVASLALIAPLALGGIQSTNVHAKAWWAPYATKSYDNKIQKEGEKSSAIEYAEAQYIRIHHLGDTQSNQNGVTPLEKKIDAYAKSHYKNYMPGGKYYKKVEEDEGIKPTSHHTNHSKGVSISRRTISQINHMNLPQLKRSIRYNRRQSRKYGRKNIRKARYSKILSIENNQLKKLNKLYEDNHSEKPSKATRTQKYEAKELRGITKQTNSLKNQLDRYGKKHNSRKSRNNIRTIKRELSNLSRKAKTLEITSLPKDA